MPITAAFTINAIAQINPAAIALVDTSTGSDATIASRQILIYQADNTLLTPAITWPYAQTSITVNPLTQDVAANVVINWLDSGGNILYQSSQIYAFRGYSELFYYQLTQAQTANPAIAADENYFTNKAKLRLELDSATNAISTGADVFGAEGCILRAIQLCTQHQTYFGL